MRHPGARPITTGLLAGTARVDEPTLHRARAAPRLRDGYSFGDRSRARRAMDNPRTGIAGHGCRGGILRGDFRPSGAAGELQQQTHLPQLIAAALAAEYPVSVVVIITTWKPSQAAVQALASEAQPAVDQQSLMALLQSTRPDRADRKL